MGIISLRAKACRGSAQRMASDSAAIHQVFVGSRPSTGKTAVAQLRAKNVIERRRLMRHALAPANDECKFGGKHGHGVKLALRKVLATEPASLSSPSTSLGYDGAFPSPLPKICRLSFRPPFPIPAFPYRNASLPSGRLHDWFEPSSRPRELSAAGRFQAGARQTRPRST